MMRLLCARSRRTMDLRTISRSEGGAIVSKIVSNPEPERSKHPAEDSWRKLRGKMVTLWARMPQMSFMFDVLRLRRIKGKRSFCARQNASRCQKEGRKKTTYNRRFSKQTTK